MKLNRDDEIQKFLNGKMSEQEESKFEEALLSDNDLLDETETMQNMREAFKAYGETNASELVQQTPATSHWWNRDVPLWSLAATFVLMLLPLTGLIDSTESDYRSVNVTNLELASLRSSGEEVVRLDSDTDIALLSIYVDRDIPKFRQENYSFSLLEQDANNKLVLASALEIDVNNMLYINLEGIAPGSYSLKIYGSGGQQDQAELKHFTLIK